MQDREGTTAAERALSMWEGEQSSCRTTGGWLQTGEPTVYPQLEEKGKICGHLHQVETVYVLYSVKQEAKPSAEGSENVGELKREEKE